MTVGSRHCIRSLCYEPPPTDPWTHRTIRLARIGNDADIAETLYNLHYLFSDGYLWKLQIAVIDTHRFVYEINFVFQCFTLPASRDSLLHFRRFSPWSLRWQRLKVAFARGWSMKCSVLYSCWVWHLAHLMTLRYCSSSSSSPLSNVIFHHSFCFQFQANTSLTSSTTIDVPLPDDFTDSRTVYNVVTLLNGFWVFSVSTSGVRLNRLLPAFRPTLNSRMYHTSYLYNLSTAASDIQVDQSEKLYIQLSPCVTRYYTTVIRARFVTSHECM